MRFKSFSDFLFEDGGPKKFGCAMVYFDMPSLAAFHRIIEKDDVFSDADGGKGLETEPHITLLFGLHDDVSDDDVLSKSMPAEPSSIILSNVSVFENDGFDVLKFDADAEWLHDVNAKLADLPHTNKYPDYHPHCTVGYLNAGAGAKYAAMLKGVSVSVSPDKIVYSKPDGSKPERQIAHELTDIKVLRKV